MSYLSQHLLNKLAKFEQDGQTNNNFGLVFNLGLCSIRYLWSNFRSSKPKPDCFNIGLVFNGNLGDQVIQLQWAKVFGQEMAQQGVPTYTVFMFEQQPLGQILSQGFEHVDLIESHGFVENHKFDVLLSLDYFPRIWHIDSASVNKYAPFLMDKLKQSSAFYSDVSRLSRPCYHYFLMQYGLAKNWTRYDMLGQCGLCQFDRHTEPFLFVDQSQSQQTLEKYGLAGKTFIVLHTGVEDWAKNSDKANLKVNMDSSISATYSLPVSFANELVLKVKQAFSEKNDLLIVQLGDPKGSAVDNVDLFLEPDLPLLEAIHILSASLSYVGSDSNWLHIYHALNKKAVVLWGSTSAAFSGYPDDINFQSTCESCMGVCVDWDCKCVRGERRLSCMMEHDLDKVALQVKTLLK